MRFQQPLYHQQPLYLITALPCNVLTVKIKQKAFGIYTHPIHRWANCTYSHTRFVRPIPLRAELIRCVSSTKKTSFCVCEKESCAGR